MGRQGKYRHYADIAGSLTYHPPRKTEKKHGKAVTSFDQHLQHSMLTQLSAANLDFFLLHSLLVRFGRCVCHLLLASSAIDSHIPDHIKTFLLLLSIELAKQADEMGTHAMESYCALIKHLLE